MARQTLFGWGRTTPSVADVRMTTAGRLSSVLADAGRRGALMRGLGRSYGDAAQNAGGLVIRLDDSVHGAALDPVAGTVRVPAGVSLDALLGEIVPRGFFVPVTPGTRLVTIGGAIASDVHGKSHHRDGSFGDHLLGMTLMLADGSIVEIGPQHDAELFWATVGGIGLTGAILDATLKLLPIETSKMVVDTTRFDDLDSLMAAMIDGDRRYRYTAAWIDPLSTGRRLGRSVLSAGDHAPLEALPAARRSAPLAYRSGIIADLPAVVPAPGLINRATVRAFNELWFRKAPRREVGAVVSTQSFFHPLDAVGEWNRVYGRRGMIQFQFVVPDDRADVVRTVMEGLSSHGTPSFLAVLKRFGAGNKSPLSFPTAGWTLALDVPAGRPGLAELLHGFDGLILDAGGRHYFAKDSTTIPEAIRRGYPRLAEWQEIRHRVDPNGLWQSDLSRRLGLTDLAETTRPIRRGIR